MGVLGLSLFLGGCGAKTEQLPQSGTGNAGTEQQREMPPPEDFGSGPPPEGGEGGPPPQ